MKTTDFARHLTAFLGTYMPAHKGASVNTIASYRDTFSLLLRYLDEYVHVPAETITLSHMTAEVIVDFLDWLEANRNSTAATRNVRLAAIHSFAKYLQYKYPENLEELQRILAIPVKKSLKPVVNYMSLEGIELLMKQPDRTTKAGRRDLAMLVLLYDSAARVQELIDLTPSSIRFDLPSSICLTGKGNKSRYVPLMQKDTELLKQYMDENHLFDDSTRLRPLFVNRKKEKLTRAGVGYVINKYVSSARLINPTIIPEGFTPHCLRHSKSMHLLQAGVSLVYIRDILGHVSVQTTEIYARADSMQKRQAIEKAYYDTVPDIPAMWENNPNLLEWLKTLC